MKKISIKAKCFIKSTDACRKVVSVNETLKSLLQNETFVNLLEQLIRSSHFNEITKEKLNTLLSASLYNRYPTTLIIHSVEHLIQEHQCTLAHDKFKRQYRRLRRGQTETFTTHSGRQIIITRSRTGVQAQLSKRLSILMHRQFDVDNLFFEDFHAGPTDIIDVQVRGKSITEKAAMRSLRDVRRNGRKSETVQHHIHLTESGLPVNFQADLLHARLSRLPLGQELSRTMSNGMKVIVKRVGSRFFLDTSINITLILGRSINTKMHDRMTTIAEALANFSENTLHNLISPCSEIFFYGKRQKPTEATKAAVIDCFRKGLKPSIQALMK